MQCSFLFLACIALAASTGPSHLKPLRCVGLLCGSVTQAGAGSAIASGPRALLCLRGGADADAEKPAFTLDGWKRTYSNADDTSSILPQFWADLQAQEEGKYSIWFVNYKNNAEYTKKLMAVNLIGGWFQRLDGTGGRKVAFGNVHVFGQEPDLEIAGVFLVAGSDIPAAFKEVADFEQWDWVKADLSDDKQRCLVEDFWKWEGDFSTGADGKRTWLAGKTYK